MNQETAETGVIVTKAATTAQYTGSAGAVVFGLTPGEWQIVGVIGGLVIAFLGFLVNISVNIYFKRQHLLLAREAAKADPEE